MATITYNGTSFTVDHAVKGADYIHGYDADGNMVVSFDGCSSFSGITYSGTYMDPGKCDEEACNSVRFVDGILKTASGSTLITLSNVDLTAGTSALPTGTLYFVYE